MAYEFIECPGNVYIRFSAITQFKLVSERVDTPTGQFRIATGGAAGGTKIQQQTQQTNTGSWLVRATTGVETEGAWVTIHRATSEDAARLWITQNLLAPTQTPV